MPAVAGSNTSEKPKSDSYTVKRGDTLLGILQKRYPQQSPQALLPLVVKLNGIRDPDHIRVGQALQLPDTLKADDVTVPAKADAPRYGPSPTGAFAPASALTDAEHQRIQRQKPLLQKVEASTGVPWEAMAALWYRESGCRTTITSRPGGPFQFDPPPGPERIQGLLSRHSSLPPSEVARLAQAGVRDFETGAFTAACFLKDKMGGCLTADAEDSVIREAFFRYNGTGYGTADKSPYVMNGYNEAYQGMKIRGTLPDGKGGRIPINRADTRPGAYVVYRQLKD